MDTLFRSLLDPTRREAIDNAWFMASQPPKGRLFSSGEKVAGVAYDLETGEFLAGEAGGDHTWAHERLLREADERHAGSNGADTVVVKGHAAVIPGFTLPLVMTRPRFIGDPSAPRADRALLERGIALPLRLAYAQAERARKRLAKTT